MEEEALALFICPGILAAQRLALVAATIRPLRELTIRWCSTTRLDGCRIWARVRMVRTRMPPATSRATRNYTDFTVALRQHADHQQHRGSDHPRHRGLYHRKGTITRRRAVQQRVGLGWRAVRPAGFWRRYNAAGTAGNSSFFVPVVGSSGFAVSNGGTAGASSGGAGGNASATTQGVQRSVTNSGGGSDGAFLGGAKGANLAAPRVESRAMAAPA